MSLLIEMAHTLGNAGILYSSNKLSIQLLKSALDLKSMLVI